MKVLFQKKFRFIKGRHPVCRGAKKKAVSRQSDYVTLIPKGSCHPLPSPGGGSDSLDYRHERRVKGTRLEAQCPVTV